MIRDDISDKLIHLVRDTSYQSAANSFLSILKEQRLRGGTNYIRGAYTCVCFSEAPIGKLAYLLAGPSETEIRYKPFGIMVDKKWLFEKGGRPVIYQPDNEFDLLCEEQRFRHVRYEPGMIDFTWEREWRIKTNELELNPDITTVVVPNRQWEDWIKKRHYATIVGHTLIAEGLLEPTIVKRPWHYLVLEDLGIPLTDVEEPQ